MIICKSINSEHQDLIHDVKYDFYGRRMVTCSSDQMIKVWELMDDQDWHCTGKLQGHIGSVWKVSWAHPEFGQVIASCGFDRTIIIWEEITNNQQSNSTGKSDWIRRTQLVDPRTPVADIQFSPRHLGLQLAACSTDGIIRLYEAQDVMDLSQWTLQHDFTSQVTASCLSWSTNPAFPTLIAVGNCNNSSNEPNVIIYEFVEHKRSWDFVESIDNINGSVHDVAFAPCMGHSFHTLAVAAANLCVFYIKPIIDNEEKDNQKPSSRYNIEIAQIITPVPMRIWRVSWNVTGTVLAASGEDGAVRFLRRNYLRNWCEISVIYPDAQGPQTVLMGNAAGIAGGGYLNEDELGQQQPQSQQQLFQQNANDVITQPIGGRNHPILFQKKGHLPNKNEVVFN